MAIVRKKEDPFLDQESAVAALKTHIKYNNKIDRGGMYLLQAIYQYIHNDKEILKRLPSKALGGLPEGGRRHVAASALLRTEGAADARKQNEILPSGYTREQEIIGQWAERDGCWSETPQADQLDAGRAHRDDLDGAEANIFYDNGARVYKTIDASHYTSYQHFLDRISIHNAIFPETAMRVEGFGMREDADSNDGFVCVVSQPFVKGSVPKMEFIEQEMAKNGFDLPDFTASMYYVSEDRTLLIGDLHDNNCVVSPKGELLVFDCEAAINCISAFEGKARIPDLEFSEQSVKKINTIIKDILPQSIDDDEVFQTIERTLGKDVKMELAKQIRTDGRINGPVDLGTGPLIIQRDPVHPGRLLVSAPWQIKALLSLGWSHDCALTVLLDDGTRLDPRKTREIIDGGAAKVGSTHYVFDLDKGRVRQWTDCPMRLKQKHEVDVAPARAMKKINM